MRFPRLTIFTRFLLLGFCVFLLIGYYLTSLIAPTLIEFTLKQSEQSSVVFANRLASEFFTEETFSQNATEENIESYRTFYSSLAIPGLYKIVIAAPDGTIRYSSDETLIGRKLAPTEVFTKATELQTTIQIEHIVDEKTGPQTQSDDAQTIVSYIPLTFGASSEVAAVLKTYARGGFLSKQISQTESDMVKRTFISLIIMFATLSFIVWKASRTVDTQRRDLETGLREQSAILSSIADAVIAVDENGTIILTNPSAQRMFDLTEREMMGKQWSSILTMLDENGTQMPPEMSPMAQALATIDVYQSTSSNPSRYARKSGIALIATETTSPILLEGKLIGAIGVYRDVTETQKLERARDEFFSIASHELRTPLTAIRGNLSMIIDYYLAELKNQDVVDMIKDSHESASRLIKIVNDFLDVSKLSVGKMTFKKDSLDLQSIVKQVEQEVHPIAAEKKLELVFKVPADLPHAIGDADRVKQVIINLLANAMNYTKEGGVTVSMQKRDQYIDVEVIDTGAGIPPDKQTLLFQKFQQAGSSIYTREVNKGTGLGLFISKTFIEGMGGEMGLVHSAPGVGSVFHFTLPIDSANA